MQMYIIKIYTSTNELCINESFTAPVVLSHTYKDNKTIV